MKTAFLGISFGITCLIEAGCATGHFTFDPVQDALDDCSYKESVKYYESRGVDSKDANRAAYEDQFFDKMGQSQ